MLNYVFKVDALLNNAFQELKLAGEMRSDSRTW